MEDTWTNRDLPVLKAAVDIYNKADRANIRVSDIERALNFDRETTQQALQFLYTEPYFKEEGSVSGQTAYVFIGPPTGDALRMAGVWPTPENLLERLIATLNAAGDDESFDVPERSKFKQAAVWLGSFASGVAISALGGAGGHMLSS
jgi:hypothetical protein